jgi:thiol:disulfide interchange protein DsbC
MSKLVFVFVSMLLVSSAGHSAVDPAVDKSIRDSLRVMLPGLAPDEINDTPVDNLYEVVFGTKLVYITGDGRFLMQGKIIDLETRSEITEDRMSALKTDAMAAVSEENMIIYGPENPKHTVTIFTDIDCGYCRKMHAQMDQYEAQGIRVRYLFYPRAGVGSDSYTKAVSVWCADDRHGAMDMAKAGQSVPTKTCDNPVADHHALGQSFGIQGTPALVLENGEVIPGYVPADKLRRALDRSAQFGG